MKERIAKFVREQAYRPMTLDELASTMGISEKQHLQLQKTLEQMEATGEVVQTRTQRYGAPERMNLAVGTLHGHPKGFGFLVTDEADSEDIFIGREALNGAWHGDRIVARLSPATRPGGRVEGDVIRILQRARQRVVGTFEADRNAGYVTPDEKRLPEDIFIPKGATNGAKSGEKVVVQVVRWPEARRNAEGKVVERLGMKGQVGVDIVSVIRKFGLPEAFPPRVLKESEDVPETVRPEAIVEEGRRDLRGWTIVTIDGEDAKDLDDAVNVERVREGVWRLGVHIADVSYYVPEGSQLDREAYERGTSVYLADRVVPMLPPRLSNGICSLNPNVDRLTLSCVMEIDAHGKVLSHEIFPSVIRTVARMTYTRVNQILAGDAEAIAEYASLTPVFREMHALMQVLRTRRERRGSLDFDLPEAKVKLNGEGWPVEIRRVDRGIAERIIEEFMLVANETVAEHVLRADVPFMYRVHGEPGTDRVAGLKEFLGLFGYNLQMPREGQIKPKLLQGIIDWSQGRPEEALIGGVLLRTMRQAVYSEENLGHFGLAADYYCHFTSPIRRYPDLVVHRVLRAMVTGGVNPKLRSKWKRSMPEAARHSSERERVAMEAERETIDIKKAEWMSERVGEVFDGMISGVTQFGFFVQLPNTVEGLVHVSTLADDYYHFQEQYYALMGERTRRRFRMGDKVSVRLSAVDVDSRQLDFTLEAAETPVVTVPAVETPTRARAEHKRALSGAEDEAEPERTGTRKRRRTRTRRPQGQPVLGQPVLGQPVLGQPVLGQPEPLPTGAESEVTAAIDPALVEPTGVAPVPTPGPGRGRQGGRTRRGTNAGKNRAAEPNRVAKAEAEEPALAPKAAPVTRSPKAAPVTRAARGARGHQTAAEGRTPREATAATQRATHATATRRVASKLDMWGIPVPEGRVSKPREESDPGVISPFALTPPPGRERSRGRKATAEAPFSPAPGTADESAGLPGTMDGGSPKPRTRTRANRPPRGGRTRAGQSQPGSTLEP